MKMKTLIISCSFIFTRPYKGWHFQADADVPYYGMSLSRAW